MIQNTVVSIAVLPLTTLFVGLHRLFYGGNFTPTRN